MTGPADDFKWSRGRCASTIARHPPLYAFDSEEKHPPSPHRGERGEDSNPEAKPKPEKPERHRGGGAPPSPPSEPLAARLWENCETHTKASAFEARAVVAWARRLGLDDRVIDEVIGVGAELGRPMKRPRAVAPLIQNRARSAGLPLLRWDLRAEFDRLPDAPPRRQRKRLRPVQEQPPPQAPEPASGPQEEPPDACDHGVRQAEGWICDRCDPEGARRADAAKDEAMAALFGSRA